MESVRNIAVESVRLILETPQSLTTTSINRTPVFREPATSASRQSREKKR